MSSEKESAGSVSNGGRASTQAVRHEVVAGSQADPIVKWLGYVIVALIVVGLSGVLYVLLAGGVLDRSAGTFPEAQLNAAKFAVEANSGDGDAWSDYITVLSDLKRYSDAERQLENGRKVLKGANLLKIELAAVDMYGAKGEYKRSLTLAKKCVDDYKKLETEQIKAEAAKGITVRPENVAPDIATRTYLTAARAAGRLEKWEEVVSYFTSALIYDPLGSDTLTRRGNAYLELGEKEKAIADFKEALKYIPDYAPAKAGLKKAGEGK